MRLIGSVLIAAGTLLISCGQSGRPPYLKGKGLNQADASGAGASEEIILGDDEDAEEACSQLSVELEIERSNFYFVVDNSLSMEEVMPGTGGLTRLRAAQTAVNEMLLAVGHRVNFGAAVFPAKGNPLDGCVPGEEVAPLRAGEPLDEDGTNLPLRALIHSLRNNSPRGATPTAPTLQALVPQLLAFPGQTHVFLLTDGAPNCDSEELCSAAECIPNIEGQELSDSVRCDDDLNCCQPGLYPELCLDRDDSEQVLSELAAAGISTQIIGMPGSEAYANALSGMAVAAGTAKAGETAYHQVTDAAELGRTLARLGQELSERCEFDLGGIPERPELVSVFVDGQAQPEGEEGWRWLTDHSVELTGELCLGWKLGDIQRVRVFEGCPIVIY